MFKFFAVIFAAFLAVAVAVPNPKPGVVSYGAPAVAYSAPLAYSAPVAYAASPVVSSYGAVPLAYSGYGTHAVVV